MNWFTVVNIIVLFLFLLVLWVPMKHALHMFQQNRYEKERYSAWLLKHVKTQYKKIIGPILLQFILIIVAFSLMKVCFKLRWY